MRSGWLVGVFAILVSSAGADLASAAEVSTDLSNTRLVVASTGSVDETIAVNGPPLDPGEDTFSVTASAGSTTTDPDCSPSSATVVVCTLPASAISIDAGPGADTVTIGSAAHVRNVPSDLSGGTGQDTLTGSQAGDNLRGGDDAAVDTLIGRYGPDRFFGADPSMFFPDIDRISYADRSATEGVTVTVDGVADDGAPGEGDLVPPEFTVIGGSGPDDFTGDATRNRIEGGAGDDVIRGGGGDDAPAEACNASIGCMVKFPLVGGLEGGDGTDDILGEGGSDRLDGGPGADDLEGGAGAEAETVRVANDIQETSFGYLVGGEGDDVLDGGEGADRFDAGGGSDLVEAADGVAESPVDCGADADTYVADPNDVLTGCETNLDGDGDGVLVADDHCDALTGPGPRGCPVAPRQVSLFYLDDAQRFTGRIRSSVPPCRSRIRVTIRRVRPGADPRVARVRSRTTGRFTKTIVARRGKYYATIPMKLVAEVAECPATRSPLERVG